MKRPCCTFGRCIDLDSEGMIAPKTWQCNDDVARGYRHPLGRELVTLAEGKSERKNLVSFVHPFGFVNHVEKSLPEEEAAESRGWTSGAERERRPECLKDSMQAWWAG